MENWITANTFGKLLGLSHTSMAYWRRKGIGPDFTQVGQNFYYSPETIAKWYPTSGREAPELEAWLKENEEVTV